ncbi:MAG: hypothetical protein HC775_03210 [Hyellaceae cyanobacterium CSU_1_1]|nr:hypothetical protein [Hyellaceae cyanobacterium CSU_1_1]
MKEFFFTAIPLNVGIGDQTDQISMLYTLGSSCAYKYVHTPLVCERSTLSSFIVRKIHKHIGFPRKSSDRLIKFLGLDKHELNINDNKFLGYQILDVNLYKLLQENNISNIFDLRKCINTIIPFSERIIYSFVWTPKMYLLKSKIQSLIDSAKVDKSTLKFKFAEKYWKARESWPLALPFDENKIKIAVHLRKGDTACIHLNNKVIDAWKLKYINSIDDAKYKQAETVDYHFLLQKIFTRYGEDKFSVVVLSDGYKRTFRRITKAMLQGKLRIYDLIELNSMERKYNEKFNIFTQHQNIFTIIGESEENLLKSIHAIICADIVISGSFGFAWRMQKFRKAGKSAFMINVNEYDEQILNSIIDYLN